MTSTSRLPKRTAIRPGIAFVALAYVLFSVSDAAVKWVIGGYPTVEVMFFAALFSLLPMVTATVARGGLATLATRRLPLHLTRGALALAGSLSGYYALGHMPLADFYAAVFTAPLFITALSAAIAQERVDRPRWLAVGFGFLGILVMVRPGSGTAGLATAAALSGAFFYALSVLLVRRMSNTESTAAFAVYGTLVSIGCTGAALPFVLVSPTGVHLSLFALAGVTMGCALLLVFGAFRRAPAAVLAPFQYSQMVWGVLFGLLLFNEHPDHMVALGSLMVIASGLYILHRETRTMPMAES